MKTSACRALFLLVAVLGLVSCARPQYPRRQRVSVTIVAVETEGPWGCIGTDVRSVVATEDGARYQLCGSWGRVGTPIVVDLVKFEGGWAAVQASP